MSEEFKERMRKYRSELDEELVPVLDHLVGEGRKPSVAIATIEHVVIGGEQKKFASKHGVTRESIKNNLPIVLRYMDENGLEHRYA